MKALICGGKRNGEWIEQVDGAHVWLDIEHADTYMIRKIGWTLTNAKGEVTETFRIYVAVHPELAGHPQEQPLVMQLLNMFAMSEFARAHGELMETPAEPSAIQRADGAVVLGPNGRPA